MKQTSGVTVRKRHITVKGKVYTYWRDYLGLAPSSWQAAPPSPCVMGAYRV